jgi:hypothetical protein
MNGISMNSPLASARGGDVIDNRRAAPFRTMDYWLGGKDNYSSDRSLVDKIQALEPKMRSALLDQRKFRTRAIQYLLNMEDTLQFIDVGCGLPECGGDIHRIAGDLEPYVRAVYVDHNPVVVSHLRAYSWLTKRNVSIVEADLGDAPSILDSPATKQLIDFSRPVAILLTAVLHHIPNKIDLQALVRALTRGLVAGSCLVISHFSADANPLAKEIAEIYTKNASAPLITRTHPELLALFDTTELVPPGLTWTSDWTALSSPPKGTPKSRRRLLYGGVGRKLDDA